MATPLTNTPTPYTSRTQGDQNGWDAPLRTFVTAISADVATVAGVADSAASAASAAAAAAAAAANGPVAGSRILDGTMPTTKLSVDVATQDELNAVAAGKADLLHTHTASQITGLGAIGTIQSAGNGTTDQTAEIQAAITAAAATAMPGMKFQNSSGVFQGGAQANGGGRVVLGPGVFVVSNLLLGHRVTLQGSGQGTILLQKAASTGPVVANRRDGTVHAQYCGVTELTINGNKANQTAANVGLLFQGDESNNYTSPLDEDYDVNCWASQVYVMNTKGDGIRLTGAGANRISDCKVRGADGNGIYSFQDNHISGCDVGWSGLAGVRVDGESVTVTNTKAWYSGAVTPAAGHGFHLTADSGAISGCNAQDCRAAGFLWDGAFGWSGSALLSDSNSRGSAATYPAFDFYGAGFNQVSGVARNRYNGAGSTAEQASALRIRNGSNGNVIDLVAATGVWGTNAAALTQAGSTTAGNLVKINGIAQ